MAGEAVANFKRNVYAVDARTIADNGTGSPATLTLTPTGSYVQLTCNDANGCTITMGETGIPDGMPVTIVNVSTNACTFADTAGVSELNGAYTMGQYDSLTLLYDSDRWVEQARSVSAGGGSGDVVGPASATTLAVARFDGTTGKLLKNTSALTLSDVGAFTFPDGVRQTFNPDGTTPGISVGSQAGDPSTPSNGDLWYDSTGNVLRARINGATVSLGAGGGSSGGGGGALVLLEQHTASASASLDFTTAITSTYDEYLIEIVGIIPATNGALPYLRVSTDGGSTYDTTAIYDWSVFSSVVGSTTSGASGSASQAQIALFNAGLLSSATPALSGSLRLFDPLSASDYKWFDGNTVAVYSGDSTPRSSVNAGVYRSATAVNAFRVLMSSGNITSGIVRVYGVAKAISSGTIMQVVNTQTGAVATGTTTIPLDDTIPQNTEGDQYMTLAITPTSATNKLKIEVVFNGTYSVTAWLIVALFQDTTAGALAAFMNYQQTGGGGDSSVFTHYMTSGTTSATTFKVRAGGQTAGTTTFNGQSAGRLLGGVVASSITITEIVP